MKMEPTVSSETSAIRTQTPENYPKRNKLHLEHGESLKTRSMLECLYICHTTDKVQEKKIVSVCYTASSKPYSVECHHIVYIALVTDKEWLWNFSGMILTGEDRSILREKLVPAPLRPPQIRHGLVWGRIAASGARIRRPNAGAYWIR